jgi:hypothetical protein
MRGWRCLVGLASQPEHEGASRTRSAPLPAPRPHSFFTGIFLTNACEYVLDTFTSAAPAAAALPDHSDATRGPVADGAPAHPSGDGLPARTRAGRLLSLLRKLIDYGQDLARTVQPGAAASVIFTVAVHFGTRDMALVIARITRGLRLAAALEAKLISRPLRLDADAAPVRAPADHTPADHAPDRARRPARRAEKRPTLPDIPTEADIAAALRHRPAAAVIADICRDLGIVPAHPLWGEVMAVLSGHGGNVMKFFKEVMARLFAALAAVSGSDAEGWPVLPPYPIAAGGTGPP